MNYNRTLCLRYPLCRHLFRLWHISFKDEIFELIQMWNVCLNSFTDQLERVFLRLGHAETDEQLQDIISKFLPPVLLKLSSVQEGVRKKVRRVLCCENVNDWVLICWRAASRLMYHIYHIWITVLFYICFLETEPILGLHFGWSHFINTIIIYN